MEKAQYKNIFRLLFFVIAFYNFLNSTDLLIFKFNWNYLYYYTNLSNFLVFVWITYDLMRYFYRKKKIKYHYTIKFGVTIGIFVTLLVYNTLLGNPFDAGYWEPTNVLNHLLLPFMMIFDYIVLTKHNTVRYKDTFYALVFPFLYLIYALIRGAFTHEYPYFFVDLNVLGVGGVIVYAVGICFFVWVFAYVFYYWNKLTKPLNS